jgi:twitching motility protein PilT
MDLDFQRILQMAVEKNASDIHILAGLPPRLRISSVIRTIDCPAPTDEQVLTFISSILPQQSTPDLSAALTDGLDFSYAIPDVTRFRCNAFRQLGRPGIVMRVVHVKIPSFEELHLPSTLYEIALARRGLVLVTGTTGSGKSTTLAAMIDAINQNEPVKIITIEDPIEFVHTSSKALISQTEVGLDTRSFEHALRQGLRQNPDVVLIGELRDIQSLRIALQAADTGHQVFSTVHSATAAQTIDRIIAMFPPAEHNLLLQQLAGSLEAIVSQRLMSTEKGGLRPAVEILRGTPVAQRLIVEGKTAELRAYIEQGESGMQSFDQHILHMFREGLISDIEAMHWSTHPEAMAMALRGINHLSHKTGTSFRSPPIAAPRTENPL